MTINVDRSAQQDGSKFLPISCGYPLWPNPKQQYLVVVQVWQWRQLCIRCLINDLDIANILKIQKLYVVCTRLARF